MSRFISLSSTNRILAIGMVGALKNLTFWLPIQESARHDVIVQQIAQLLQQHLARVASLLENRLDMALQLATLFTAKIVGREHYDGNQTPIWVSTHPNGKLEAIHFGHHQV